MNKKSNFGFYNKYIFNNNSYLSLHIIRDTCRNNPDSKNIDILIDDALQKNYMTQRLVIIKKKVQNKKVRFNISDDIPIRKNDKFTNTGINMINQHTNTSPTLYYKKPMNKINSNNASLINRINKY